MDQVIPVISPEFDVLDRIAARYGLTFTLDEYSVNERDEHGSRTSREATDAELSMWRSLVPEDLREICANVWRARGPFVLPATPEEVYSAVLYRQTTYLCAEDFTVLLGLPCFVPAVDRASLLDGLVGAVDGLWRVYVSRAIPRGYCHSPDRDGVRTDVLHPFHPSGTVRELRPAPSEEDFWRISLRPLLTETASYDFSDMLKPPCAEPGVG